MSIKLKKKTSACSQYKFNLFLKFIYQFQSNKIGQVFILGTDSTATPSSKINLSKIIKS